MVAEVIGGLLSNSLALLSDAGHMLVDALALGLSLFAMAYQRFLDPPPVHTPIMILVAAIGLMANLAGIFLLRRASHRSLNIKAAFWHIIGDTISSVGVIVAGIIIAVTGWYVADAIIAVLIGGIILWGAIRIVRESSDILLEAVPRHIQADKVIKAIKSVPGVEKVHDVHIWCSFDY
jgi:cobalt-zinc-cadmium efflux system protein